jgi:hypothetical protein
MFFSVWSVKLSICNVNKEGREFVKYIHATFYFFLISYNPKLWYVPQIGNLYPCKNSCLVRYWLLDNVNKTTIMIVIKRSIIVKDLNT